MSIDYEPGSSAGLGPHWGGPFNLGRVCILLSRQQGAIFLSLGVT